MPESLWEMFMHYVHLCLSQKNGSLRRCFSLFLFFWVKGFFSGKIVNRSKFPRKCVSTFYITAANVSQNLKWQLLSPSHAQSYQNNKKLTSRYYNEQSSMLYE